MPISSAAIERYLSKAPESIPDFRAMTEPQAYAYIEQSTGVAYEWRTQPRLHQVQGLAFALHVERGLLFYQMRLGKSKIALDWASHLKRCGLWTGKGIVIVHAPIGLDVWRHEAEKHTDLKVCTVGGSIDELIAAIESDCDLIVMSWYGLQSVFTIKKKTRKGTSKLYPNFNGIHAAAACFSLAIIDEIHGAKNHQSLRFLIGAALTKDCRFRLGLTGTPFGRNPFDVWAQAFLVDRGATLGYNYYFFEGAFGRKSIDWATKRTVYIFDEEKRNILKAKLRSISLACTLEEYTETNVITGTVELAMTARQLAAYNDVINKLIKIDEHERVELMATFTRLRQVSSGYLPFSDSEGTERVLTFDKNPKLEWLSELIQEIPRDMQALVFYEFTPSGKSICDALTEAHIKYAWLWSGTKDRAEEVRRFQAGEAQIMVANTAAGGMSINLPAADYVCFYESTASPIIRAQAEARPMARGTRPLVIDNLVVSPVEAKILAYLAEGKDMLKSIVHERRSLRATPRR